jgi:flagellar basal-body rod modification protein FlgD
MVNFPGMTDPSGVGNSAQPQAANNTAAVGKDAFMQLLVAQIRNQNPLNPADGVEFLSQLAQFSQLEQSMGIREEITSLREQVASITEAMQSKETEGK